VAGAAALLKAARPGLTTAQYKSLLVNTASPASGTVMQTGAGSLNMLAALQATAAVEPVAVDFSTGTSYPIVIRSIAISNVGAAPAVFEFTAIPQAGGPAPALTPGSLSLAPGQSGQVTVVLVADALPPGQYQGTINIDDTSNGLAIEAPYWYAVPSNVPAQITVLQTFKGASKGQQLVQNAVLFRVTDTSGIAMTSLQPVVTVISGGASVAGVTSADAFIPGAYSISLRPGPQGSTKTVLQVQAGDVSVDVTVPI
jgi:minor extracellular serine protease Vpr